MVLLVGINAKYIHTTLAVRSLQANAGKYRKDVEIAEYTINHRREEIFQDIYRRKPEAVGFSCYLWNIEYVMGLAGDLKKVLPNLFLFFGGPEVSYHPEEVLAKYEYADLVMVGEGERTFQEFMAYLVDGDREISSIDGIVYRGIGGLHRTKPRQGLDMDDLVYPYDDMETLKNRIIYYESMRGCPFSCSYCLSSIEKSVRIKSPEKTERELDFFLENKVPQVKFVDRTFNCNHAYAYRIWKYIGEHDNGVTNFHFEIGGDLLHEEDFLLFDTFRPGLVQFEIGVQSTNPDTLKAIRRTADWDLLQKNVARIHARGNIHQHLDLIAGLPYDTTESFKNSIDRVIELDPENITVHTLTLKRASRIVIEDQKENDYADVAAMLEKCHLLAEADYRPYYLYRQKNTLQNLENVGWCKPGHEGYYNIYIMEEVQTILSAGAGGSTKLVADGGRRMQRIFNFKYPNEYIQRFAEVLERKKGVAEFYDHDLGTETTG